ncbi:outer membrane beta-barrel protein, partial [Armatimonas sp.]|uniref:outer membrane beta-barrel protein n=1 Tax=Armatimonas sp. TaxID=1872638 RepID=UPI00286B6DA0
SADFTPVLGAALRVDYIKDNDGYGTGGLLGFANTPFGTPPGNNTGQDLSSFTLTLNWRPAKNIKIQPEIRYDHTSAGLFDGQNGTHHRVIAGVGVSYLF